VNNLIRPLSIHEASFPVYGDLCPGGGNIVASLQLKGRLTVDECHQALRSLMIQKACLRVGIQWLKKGNDHNLKAGYYFVELPEPTIELSNSQSSSEQYDQAVSSQSERLLNQPFQEGQLLWRVHLLSDSLLNRHTLFFCINHGISDGASVTFLLRDWIQQINREGLEMDSPSLSKQPLANPLWSSMPKSIAGPLGAFSCLSMLPAFIKGQKLADLGLNFESGFNAPISEHRCMATYRRLHSAQARRVLSLAKEEGKSVHGLIASGLIHPLLQRVRDSQSPLNDQSTFQFPFVSSVNMRDKALQNTDELGVIDIQSLGCLSSGVVSMIQVKKDEFQSENFHSNPWVQADQVNQGIETAFNKNEHWKVLRFYQLVGLNGLKRMFLDASEKPLATPISFANLGKVQFGEGETDKLQVSAFEVYAAFHASGAGVNVTANTLNGELTLCFSCPAPSMDRTDLEKYADEAIQLLEQWTEAPEANESQPRMLG